MKKILFVLSFILVIFTTGCAMAEDAPTGGTFDLEEGEYLGITKDSASEITTTAEGFSTYTSDEVTVTFGERAGESFHSSVYTDGSKVETTYGDSTITVITTTPTGEVTTSIYDMPQAGQLTVSELSDYDDFDYFKSLFTYDQDQGDGIFTHFYDPTYFDPLNLITVTVENGTVPLQGVLVEYEFQDEVVYRAVTNAKGIAYLLPDSDEVGLGKIRYSFGEDYYSEDSFDYDNDSHEVSKTINEKSTKSNLIELMFVIDTTGSMRDELEFLQSEIDDVIDKLYEEIPTADIQLALLFYKDDTDDYVTRYFDFSSDIEGQMLRLNAQSASGGGDFPEAVDVALSEAVSKQWSSQNSTKLIFHVLDAPPHTTVEADMYRYSDAVKSAAEQGIRIIPIASSGIDKETEYLLRTSAIYTGGTYLYLTDDSGIGGEHIEATSKEPAVVEYLNLCLIRIIKEYYTGEDIDPVPYNPEQ